MWYFRVQYKAIKQRTPLPAYQTPFSLKTRERFSLEEFFSLSPFLPPSLRVLCENFPKQKKIQRASSVSSTKWDGKFLYVPRVELSMVSSSLLHDWLVQTASQPVERLRYRRFLRQTSAFVCPFSRTPSWTFLVTARLFIECPIWYI